MEEDPRDGAPGHDFLFWQREVYEHLNRAPEKGKNKGKAPKVWQTQWEKPKKGGKGSPPTPPQFHGRTTGLSRIPKAWRTAEIITSTTARSGRMGGCVMPPIEATQGAIGPVASQSQLGSQATTTRATAEGRQSGGGQDGLRWGGTFPGCHRPGSPSTERLVPWARPLSKAAVPGVALVGGGVTSLPGGPTGGHQGDSGAGAGRPALLPGHLAQRGSEHSGGPAGGHRPAPDLAGHLATQEGRNRSSRNAPGP